MLAQCSISEAAIASIVPDAGLRLPTSGTNDASVGDVAWTNPGNITADDGTLATVVLALNQTSQYLVATGFASNWDPPIPNSAVVLGVMFAWKVGTLTGVDIKDQAARMVKAGVIGSTDRSVADNWTTTSAYLTHGHDYDLWGNASLAGSDVNASNFGAALRCVASVADTGRVDAVKARVFWVPMPVAAVALGFGPESWEPIGPSFRADRIVLLPW